MIRVVQDHDVGKFPCTCADGKLFLKISKRHIFRFDFDLILLSVEFLDDMAKRFLMACRLPVIPDRNIP